MSERIALGVVAPVSIAAIAAVWALVRWARSADPPSRGQRLLEGLALALAVAAVWARRPALEPVPMIAAFTVVVVFGLLPVVALRARSRSDPPRHALGAALLATALLGFAAAVDQMLGLAPLVGRVAVGQIGEIRLFGAHPDHASIEPWVPLPIQLVMLGATMLPIILLFVEGTALFAPLIAWRVVQYAYHLPVASVFRASAASVGAGAGLGAAVGLAVALHPFALDKLAFDFSSAGALGFVLAYWGEASERRWAVWAGLIVGATGHPIMAAMATLWALDHARRAWRSSPARRTELAWLCVVVLVLAATSGFALVGMQLIQPEAALAQRLAFYSRRAVSEAMAAGEYGWIAPMLGVNALRGLLWLLPYGLLAVARPSRFLVYLLPEIAYSLVLPNGFEHGSLLGGLGILACATLEAMRTLDARSARRLAIVGALSIAPLTMWWDGDHFAVHLVSTTPIDRLAGASSLLTPEDSRRVCATQASTYAWLTGRCATVLPMRLGDDAITRGAREADVFVLDVTRARERAPRVASLRRWLEPELPEVSQRRPSFDWRNDLATDDAAWLIERIEAGDLTVTERRGELVRLERATAGRVTGDASEDRELLDALRGLIVERGGTIPSPAAAPEAASGRDAPEVPPTVHRLVYDGVLCDDLDHVATLSGFRLDRHEVTVARFREFLSGGGGTSRSPPRAGAGASPRLDGSGWRAEWDRALEPERAIVERSLACGPAATWTDEPGPTDAAPINCVTWYEAFAFCAWAGGRLPTEAEWDAAAAGGEEQRERPWSAGPGAEIDRSYAVYGSSEPASVGSCSPRGDGRWGHADLVGNVWEWTLDGHSGEEILPVEGASPCSTAGLRRDCVDCASLDQTASRVLRGGGFGMPAIAMRGPIRRADPPSTRFPVFGFRCAYDGPSSPASVPGSVRSAEARPETTGEPRAARDDAPAGEAAGDRLLDLLDLSGLPAPLDRADELEPMTLAGLAAGTRSERVIVVTACLWDPSSVESATQLARRRDELRAAGAEILLVLVDGARRGQRADGLDVITFTRAHRIPHPIAMDASGASTLGCDGALVVEGVPPRVVRADHGPRAVAAAVAAALAP